MNYKHNKKPSCRYRTADRTAAIIVK